MSQNNIKPEKPLLVVHRYCWTNPTDKQTRGMISVESKRKTLKACEVLIQEIRKNFPGMDLDEVVVVPHNIKGLPGDMGVTFNIEGEVPSNYLEIGKF
jgi:hypothetical protein